MPWKQPKKWQIRQKKKKKEMILQRFNPCITRLQHGLFDSSSITYCLITIFQQLEYQTGVFSLWLPFLTKLESCVSYIISVTDEELQIIHCLWKHPLMLIALSKLAFLLNFFSDNLGSNKLMRNMFTREGSWEML